jgi:acetyl-CoA carboxylase biotin carboxylase subunit
MNTRLQVEHPVTEAITGIDLVREQIRVARGEKLSFHPRRCDFFRPCHRMPYQCRKPRDLHPSPGLIQTYHPPGGLGVRMDSAVYSGYAIPPYYDSLIGKLIIHADDREACLMRLPAPSASSPLTALRQRYRYLKNCCPMKIFMPPNTIFTGWKNS